MLGDMSEGARRRYEALMVLGMFLDNHNWKSPQTRDLDGGFEGLGPTTAYSRPI